jgi:6-pyruvoyl-tetrahydropterin synthase
MKATLKKHIINARGSCLNKKIVVFESDDWGAIRIPTIETRDELLQKGLIRKNDPFSKYDSLETTEDYQMLFEVLKKHTDKKGHYPVITANFILNNPDFNKIAANDFKKYYSESFKETYNNKIGSEKAWETLNKGIENQLILPQFHGSEHLNVVRWMNKLKTVDERFRFAFDKECYAIDELGNENRRQNLMAAYDYNNDSELDFVQKSIRKGLNQFEEIFGFKSLTNISPCYVWDTQVEQELLKGGVKGFQGSFLQNYPITGESFKKKYRYIGQKNKDKQLYFVRNCLFEPSLNTNIDWVSKCMESIDIAFKWGKPAIIGTHRINFSGRLDAKQRDNNLKLLEQLLTKITRKWPDVKFTDSPSLLQNYIK